MLVIAEWFSNLDPWWIFSAALFFIFLDWALLQTEAFLTLGLALIPMGFLHALGAPAQAHLWLFPFYLILAFYSQRYFFNKIWQSESLLPFGQKDLSLIGQIGKIDIVVSPDSGASYFYKSNANLIDPGTEPAPQKVFRVIFEDGSIYPAIPPERSTMQHGDPVVVVAVRNGACQLRHITET